MTGQPCSANKAIRVGVFDSGLGGLSVFRQIAQLRPDIDLIYYADQARIPWGPRSAQDLHLYCRNICLQWIHQQCDLIVVACNTASAAALSRLRLEFPQQCFVGMEPAIKPAAQLTRSGVIGLLATPATLAGELLAQTRARHAAHVRIVSDPCQGLVEAIESTDPQQVNATLAQILPRILEADSDVLVLGCTHYVFAAEAMRAQMPSDVQILDPAPAVAAQVNRLLPAPTQRSGQRQFWTSGDPQTFSRRASALLQHSIQAQHADWVTAPLP
nr:glutamate racemase [Oceanococcus sp. HetDA_MAG_MS8]